MSTTTDTTELEAVRKRAAELQVHTIANAYGDLERISTSDDDAWMAESENKAVSINVPMVEVWAEIAPTPPEEYMGDAQWQELSPSLMVLAEQIESNYTPEPHLRQSPWFPETPTDLPDEVISSRLDLIVRYFSPLDTRAYLELTELRLAREHNRPVNQMLFTEKSLTTPWASLFSNDQEALTEAYDQLGEYYRELSSQNASERAVFGDSDLDSAIQEAAVKQNLVEMEQFILQRQHGLGPEDLWDEPEEEPGDSDIPY